MASTLVLNFMDVVRIQGAKSTFNLTFIMTCSIAVYSLSSRELERVSAVLWSSAEICPTYAVTKFHSEVK